MTTPRIRFGKYRMHGSISILVTAAVSTGYFQDRLLPSLIMVYDANSKPGAAIHSTTYRFTQNFSACSAPVSGLSILS